MNGSDQTGIALERKVQSAGNVIGFFSDKRQYIRKILSVALLFSLLFLPLIMSAGVCAPRQKNVLILNSYNYGLAWTDEQTTGIMNTLRQAGHHPIFSVEYLDWKNGFGTDNWDTFAAVYRVKYAARPVDLIMATDDAALVFALKYRHAVFYGAPVVFSGVEQEAAERIIAGHTDVTGVYENIDVEGCLQLMRSFNPQLKKIYVLYDQTESGVNTQRPVEVAVKKLQPDLAVHYLYNYSFAAITDQLKGLSDDSAVLLTTYSRDRRNVVMEMDRFAQLFSAASAVPVYITYDFELGLGPVGGSMLNGREQGEAAARLALRVLAGEPAAAIPREAGPGAHLALDYQAVQRYKLPLARIPDGVTLINHPQSFYEQYKTSLLTLLAVLLFLLVYSVSLTVNVRRRIKAEADLKRNHDELTALYEEVLASEEELHQQYQTLQRMKDELTQSEERYKYLAYQDPVTGLPNRVHFQERLEQVLAGSKRSRDAGAILFIDLDNFKAINDTFGHYYGDKLLKAIGDLLGRCGDAFLARMGGDEFIVLLEPIADEAAVAAYAEKVLNMFREVIVVDAKYFHVSVSIGITIFARDADNPEKLLQNADLALYRAKAQGKDRFVFYDRAMGDAVRQNMMMERSLRQAIAEREFQLWYQPQVRVDTGEIVGFEALLRWFSKKHGLVMPLQFIRLAEETGLIIPIGYLLLEEVCGFIADLRRDGYHNVKVTVNISVIQLMQADFVERVDVILAQAGILPSHIGFEITESVLMESLETGTDRLEALRRRGIKIHLDDFGTGYSSLRYLQQLPVDVVKIDKSFIDSIGIGSREQALTESIIQMVRRMGLEAIAEGVETASQVAVLKNLACNVAQGYYFSVPLPVADARELLAFGRLPAARTGYDDHS